MSNQQFLPKKFDAEWLLKSEVVRALVHKSIQEAPKIMTSTVIYIFKTRLKQAFKMIRYKKYLDPNYGRFPLDFFTIVESYRLMYNMILNRQAPFRI